MRCASAPPCLRFTDIRQSSGIHRFHFSIRTRNERHTDYTRTRNGRYPVEQRAWNGLHGHLTDGLRTDTDAQRAAHGLLKGFTRASNGRATGLTDCTRAVYGHTTDRTRASNGLVTDLERSLVVRDERGGVFATAFCRLSVLASDVGRSRYDVNLT